MTRRTIREWIDAQPRYLRTAEVADLLHVSPKTVSRWATEGKLPFLRTLGAHRRYPEAQVLALRDKLTYQPPVDPGEAST
jgi:excisionase family DNA binding protein